MGAAPATGGKSSSLEHSTVRHCTAILIALQGSATHPCIQPRFTEAESAGANLTREEVIAALLSPSIKWMGDSTKWVMRKSLHSQKFAQLLRSCQLKSTHCPCLPRCASPLFPSSTDCRQQLQPEDCCRLCSHWIACQEGNVDFNPRSISCAA